MTNWRALGVDLGELFGVTAIPVVIFLTLLTLIAIFLGSRAGRWEDMSLGERDSMIAMFTAAALRQTVHTFTALSF
jgi:hypothetical protein